MNTRTGFVGASVMLAFTGVLAGCHSDPAPPTIDDARVLWHHLNDGLHYRELLDIKKTDGQMAEVNGVKVYTLFYEAHSRYLTELGGHKAGYIDDLHSNYGLQRTEKGWQAGNGDVF